jgi:hypothetical protein
VPKKLKKSDQPSSCMRLMRERGSVNVQHPELGIATMPSIWSGHLLAIAACALSVAAVTPPDFPAQNPTQTEVLKKIHGYAPKVSASADSALRELLESAGLADAVGKYEGCGEAIGTDASEILHWCVLWPWLASFSPSPASSLVNCASYQLFNLAHAVNKPQTQACSHHAGNSHTHSHDPNA